MDSSEQTIRIASYQNAWDNEPRPLDVTWEELCRRLSRFKELPHDEEAKKTREGWSPTEYPPGSIRKKENVLTITCAVLDFDKGKMPEPYMEKWQAMGLCFAVHSSHSSTVERPAWRAVFPLVKPISAEEWPNVWRRIALGLGGGEIDPACKDCSRLYFLPTTHPGGFQFTYIGIGCWLDVETLPEIPEPPKAPPPPPRETPLSGDEQQRLGQRIIDQALQEIVYREHPRHGHGRHQGALYAAVQLRDNGFSPSDIWHLLLYDFLPRCPKTNTKGEVEVFGEWQIASVWGDVVKTPPRDPWSPPRAESREPRAEAEPPQDVPPPEPPPFREAPGEDGEKQSEGKPPPRQRIQLFTAPELMELKLPPRRYVIPDLLPEGLCIFAGKSKTGKSWTALGLAVAVASVGGKAFGRFDTDTGDVLYLALEDNEESLQERLGLLLQGAPPPERLTFAFEWRRANEGGIRDIEEWLKAHPDARLVIIDVLAKIKPRPKNGSGNGNHYEEDYELLDPLKRLADRYHVTIHVLHHLRKLTAEDPLDQVLGSIGMTGAPDTVWIFNRARKENGAKLFVTGRRIRQEQERSLTWDPAAVSWTDMGDADEIADTHEQQEILDYLRNSGPSKPKQIADGLGKNVGTITKLCSRMKEQGRLSQETWGQYAIVIQPGF